MRWGGCRRWKLCDEGRREGTGLTGLTGLTEGAGRYAVGGKCEGLNTEH